MRKIADQKGIPKASDASASGRRRLNRLFTILLVLLMLGILLPTIMFSSGRKPLINRETILAHISAGVLTTDVVPTESTTTTTDSRYSSTRMPFSISQAPASERLVRIRNEDAMRKYRFFRLRNVQSGLWLSRPVNTNAENTSAIEKTFQFRYHSGHYEGWSIQGHTRMHLTSENNDRITVDRLWARGYEMWFAAFGGPDALQVSSLRKLLSKETSNNKNTHSEGDFLYLVSRRNRKAISIKDDQLWATGDFQNDIARFELYAVDSPSCKADAVVSDEAMSSALVEEQFISNLTRKKQKKKVDVHGEKFQSIVRAIMCWGPVPRFHQDVSITEDSYTDMFPLFGSPKPPTQIFPSDPNNAYDGVLIARRTITNWALLPGMAPLLLADKDITGKLVESVTDDLQLYGASKMPKTNYSVAVEKKFEIHSQYSQPTYRGLFKAALKAFPSAPAVMYSNMDILYTPHLVHTLRAMLRFVDEDKERQLRALRAKGLSESLYKVKGWMIVGQRINYEVPADWSPLSNSDWADDMESRFARKGEVFESDAEDYFIVSRDIFDWSQIPDFVVGGVAFDNWLVSKGNEMAIEGTAIVVDATKTIVALHQNHGKNSKDSHKHPKSQYNSHLAAMHGGITLGHTSDALFATEIDPQGRISVYDKHRLLFK